MTKRAKRTWLFFVIGVVALAVIGGGVAARQLVAGQKMFPQWVVRTFALLGYLCVFVAALSALYMRELVRLFGRPFVKTHHVVTVTGLILLALHGLIVTIGFGPSVLVPNLGSLRLFFTWGGPIALYLIGIASLAALLRSSSLRKQWRYLHWLNYLAFLLATTHALLLGSDFQSTAMKVIPIVLALALVAVFVFKRLQRGKMQSKRR